MEKTYLMISDGHFSWRWQPVEIEIVLGSMAKVFGRESKITNLLARHYHKQRESHIAKAIKSAVKTSQYDGLISLGDNIHGWTNLGAADEAEHEEAKYFRDWLLSRFEFNCPPIWVPGNHDLGYYNCSLSPLGSKIPGSLNYDHYQKIYGPSYGLRELNEVFSFLWLSTAHVETAYAASKIKNEAIMDYLVTQEKIELLFLEEQLQTLDRLFFIGIHDPGSYVSPRLQTILNRHQEKICASFTGHIHARWLMNLAKLVRPSLKQAFNKYHIQFIPSLWGIIFPCFFWATGAGYGRLILNGDQAELENNFIGSPFRYRVKLR